MEYIAQERQQVAPPTPPTPAAQTSSEPKQQDQNEASKKDNKEIKSQADLDVVLRELTREKELVRGLFIVIFFLFLITVLS